MAIVTPQMDSLVPCPNNEKQSMCSIVYIESYNVSHSKSEWRGLVTVINNYSAQKKKSPPPKLLSDGEFFNALLLHVVRKMLLDVSMDCNQVHAACTYVILLT